jgi:hypothetical protein
MKGDGSMVSTGSTIEPTILILRTYEETPVITEEEKFV